MTWVDFSAVQWRKSSYTDGSGGQCVEVGYWQKSSYSGGSGGQCVEVAQWRKSNHSGGSGGACVELGQWRKSSYTDGSGGDCVEVGTAPPVVAVRDSKDPEGPKLVFGGRAWVAFSDRVKSGELDL